MKSNWKRIPAGSLRLSMFSRHVMNASSPEKEANFLLRLKKKLSLHYPGLGQSTSRNVRTGRRKAFQGALPLKQLYCQTVSRFWDHIHATVLHLREHRAQTSSWPLTNYLKETILWRGVYFFSWLKEIQAILPKKHEHWPFFPCQWDLAGGAEWMGFLKLSR